MNVIPPLTITSAILLSSTVADVSAGEIAWVSGAAYAAKDVRVREATGRKYERITAGAGTVPPELDTVNWMDAGPSNKWAMFDLLRNSQTVSATPVTVVLKPGKRIDSLALLGMEATSATISVTVAGTVVYAKAQNLNNRETLSWSDYYRGAFSTQPSLVLFDLPPYSNAQITITLTNTTGAVKCGACVVGTAIHIGDIEPGAESDGLNFSVIERDSFGGARLVPRRSVPKTIQSLFVEKSRVNKVRAVRELLNAVPAVWAGIVDAGDGYFESFLILGVYKKFTINAWLSKLAKVSLELEEI